MIRAAWYGTGSSNVAPGPPRKLREDADLYRRKASLVAVVIWASRARVAKRSKRAERLVAEASEARWFGRHGETTPAHEAGSSAEAVLAP